MPNHVINRLEIHDADYDAVMAKLISTTNPNNPGKQEVDFSLIVPEPEECVDLCGWRREAWGCKWNAYETQVTDLSEVWFETPWNHPYIWLIELSLEFPEATFRIDYADEDYGSNCGYYYIKNGERLNGKERIWEDTPEMSQAEAVIFAYKMWGLDPVEMMS